MFIRNSLIGLSAVMVLSACASTQSSSDNQAQPPVNTPSVNAAPVAALVSAAAEPADTKPMPDLIAPPAAQQLVQATMPYQCMLAMAKTMQDAMSPWMGSAKSCDASPAAPR